RVRYAWAGDPDPPAPNYSLRPRPEGTPCSGDRTGKSHPADGRVAASGRGVVRNTLTEELQSITGPFGTLLREIVATIDQHGLKRRYLKRHERAVAKFFQSIATQTYRSEAAEALQVRLIKYQDKLFQFLKHDGVPWNNNNAENAIRRFGYYREDNAGRLKES